MNEQEDMGAGPELDRVVAERLGFHADELESIDDPDDDGWYVVAPDEQECYPFAAESEQCAWDLALMEDECGGYCGYGLLPWSTSVDAATDLIPDDVVISTTRSGVAWEVSLYCEDRAYTRLAPRSNPALAIVRAWLAWREAEEPTEP